jgi:hypothetical protein
VPAPPVPVPPVPLPPVPLPPVLVPPVPLTEEFKLLAIASAYAISGIVFYISSFEFQLKDSYVMLDVFG